MTQYSRDFPEEMNHSIAIVKRYHCKFHSRCERNGVGETRYGRNSLYSNKLILILTLFRIAWESQRVKNIQPVIQFDLNKNIQPVVQFDLKTNR